MNGVNLVKINHHMDQNIVITAVMTEKVKVKEIKEKTGGIKKESMSTIMMMDMTTTTTIITTIATIATIIIVMNINITQVHTSATHMKAMLL